MINAIVMALAFFATQLLHTSSVGIGDASFVIEDPPPVIIELAGLLPGLSGSIFDTEQGDNVLDELHQKSLIRYYFQEGAAFFDGIWRVKNTLKDHPKHKRIVMTRQFEELTEFLDDPSPACTEPAKLYLVYYPPAEDGDLPEGSLHPVTWPDAIPHHAAQDLIIKKMNSLLKTFP